MKNIILKYSVLLVIAYLIEWWLFSFSGFISLTYIPYTPINIEGLFLITILLIILIPLHKQLLRLDNSLSIWKLTLIGATVCLIAEIIFRLIRQIEAHTIVWTNEEIFYQLAGACGLTLFGGVLSFLISYQLNTKRTNNVIAFIFILLIAVYFIRKCYYT